MDYYKKIDIYVATRLLPCTARRAKFKFFQFSHILKLYFLSLSEGIKG
jgi:hypothetical protein